MAGGSHPGTEGRCGTALSIRDVLRIGLPLIADSGKSIVRFRITGTGKHVRHLAERGHLVSLELCGMVQERTDREWRRSTLVRVAISTAALELEPAASTSVGPAGDEQPPANTTSQTNA